MRVIVNSLPKSGTHVLTTLMDCLGFMHFRGGLTGVLVRESHSNPLRNWLKRRRRPRGNERGLWVDLDIQGNRVSHRWLHSYLERIPEGAYITGHLPYSHELSEFLAARGFKLLHITRDPRDVMISYINFQKNRDSFPFHEEFRSMDLDAAISHVLNEASKGAVIAAPLKERIQNTLGWISDPKVLSTTFEDLVGEKGGGSAEAQLQTVAAVCAFLGLEFEDSRLRAIASAIFDTGSATFHKGLIRQWDSVLDAGQLQAVEASIGTYITELGYR